MISIGKNRYETTASSLSAYSTSHSLSVSRFETTATGVSRYVRKVYAAPSGIGIWAITGPGVPFTVQ